MLFVVYGLLGVAVVIAVLAIGNTLALSIHDRTRELGLVRALGQDRRQVRAAVRWESVIIALFGTIGGVAAGAFFGWGLMRAMRVQEGFGTFALPVTPLAVVLGLAGVAGVAAALAPGAPRRPHRHPRGDRLRLTPRLLLVVRIPMDEMPYNPFRPWRHPVRLWRVIAYDVTGFVTAAITFTFVVAFLASTAALLITFVMALPFAWMLFVLSRGFGKIERSRIAAMAGRAHQRPGAGVHGDVVVRAPPRTGPFGSPLAGDRLPPRPLPGRRAHVRVDDGGLGRLGGDAGGCPPTSTPCPATRPSSTSSRSRRVPARGPLPASACSDS